jgi:H+/Cl- antiporter ClcA
VFSCHRFLIFNTALNSTTLTSLPAGRIFGRIVQIWAGPSVTIYLPGYALVGACAFASGTTHTISAAVVMMESTGQFTMFLPCLMGAIVGSGVVKG